MRETSWEILKCDIAGIGNNLVGNLIGFIFSMVCCVLVFLFVQENLCATNTTTDQSPKLSVPTEYNQLMSYIPTLDEPLLVEDFYHCDMFSFPLVTDVRNNSIYQEQRGLITHPIIQRQLDEKNHSVHPVITNQVDCLLESGENMSRIYHKRVNRRIRYKSL
jgi:hypothetical protein